MIEYYSDYKIVYPFIKSDGYLAACYKGCPNCIHCSDVLWDYSNGIYACICKIHEEHETCCLDYENDGTEPVTAEEFIKMKTKEMEDDADGIQG